MLQINKHVKFFLYHMKSMPSEYQCYHQHRMTFLYFCVSGLDILGYEFSKEEKSNIKSWVYSQQSSFGGFRGGNKLYDDENSIENYDYGHLAMSYTALCLLTIVGDDLSGVNVEELMKDMRMLQQKDGNFMATRIGGEKDIRFLYCACAVCSILNDWSGMDKELTLQYVINSQRYDGAFSNVLESESHGGSTYCAVSSLFLMEKLHLVKNSERLCEWLLNRQIAGFNGRPHKLEDTCYTFWIGSTLLHLNMIQFVDHEKCKSFIFPCQESTGGIGKDDESYPDLLHTYMSICGLSLLGDQKLRKIYPALGLTFRAKENLKHPLPKLK